MEIMLGVAFADSCIRSNSMQGQEQSKSNTKICPDVAIQINSEILMWCIIRRDS